MSSDAKVRASNGQARSGAFRLLWIGPWHSDVACHQVRGPMAQALREQGKIVSTIVIGKPGSWQTGGYDRITYLPKRRTLAGKILDQFRLGLLAAKYDGDVVVLGEKAAHLALFAWLGRLLARRTTRIVIDIRTQPVPTGTPGDGDRNGSPRGHLRYRQLRMGFPFADGWMAITRGVADEINRVVNTRNLPQTVWASGVDKSFLEHKGNPSEAILKHGHEVNLLYLGSLARGREMDLAVRGMALLADDRAGLHLVGDGDHIPELRSLAQRLGLSRRVHLHGGVPYSEVPSVIAGCDLGILPLRDCPTWNTSSALKLFEYMALGKPVLVSDIPAHRDLLDGQPFAFFMAEYSPEGFVASLKQFLAVSDDNRRRLAQQAREFVRKGHTWDARAAVITDFLRRLCGKTASAAGPVHQEGKN